MTNVTPMMKQYLSIKDQYPDALLLFRLGDFYELFYEDAITASKVLEITLTTRDKKKDPIPMCGVPYHSVKGYIEKLIDNGFKVAICEQMEDPATTKGMVKREVVRIITPGTLIDDFGMDDASSNYILSLFRSDYGVSIAYSDISTGEISSFFTTDLDLVKSEIGRIRPREIVVNDASEVLLKELFKDPPFYTVFNEIERFELDTYSEIHDDELSNLSLLMTYIYKHNMKELKHFKPVQQHNVKAFMQLNYVALSNLELIESLQTKKTKGSLYWYLNRTTTPMGKRKLKKWIEKPLIDLNAIKDRHHVVNTLLEHFIEREDLKAYLDHVYDIERLVGRLSFGNVDAKDLVQLMHSLEKLPDVKTLLDQLKLTEHHLFNDFDPLKEVHEVLSSRLNEDAPKTVREGNIFKSGFNEELDRLRDISKNGRAYLDEYIEAERTRTGIRQLKVGYNKVFGYYIEISKANALNFDAEAFSYHRKQTLTNAERFITPELKEMEDEIINAQDESVRLEYQLFLELRELMESYIQPLQMTAEHISTLDCLISFAHVTSEYQLVKPRFDQNVLSIEDGRHPVVERVIGQNTYVPNSIDMDNSIFMYLITGPNMSGKSTYIRQTAIISVMAQMGMYVPAKSATLPIFDQIFTRIGASDDLASGKSTFMIEMLEANDALQNATKDSLIVFDELGRGTSTYDGMALAQAMLEYIHNNIGAKTLFSTHYHELTQLDQTMFGLKNVHVKASEHQGKLVFLHKVKSGAVERSYGVHVARLAELPEHVTKRADELLFSFEKQAKSNENQLSLSFEDTETPVEQSEIELILESLDINQLTPIDALNELQRLKDKLGDN
ncbi:DNA mismatch repair protein MutS [Aliicoccus persicus]|uniref:DNA mismatch repair protein MutS n=1 Tax=Aliicoccus persicus TaxID=930138 RepID=A0A662Z0I5_9STAP|nr:DNA mismatch repair protein MutS [Aliicoccus persicus]SEV82190.1 DNA mismatch repair protein MutS [Aliicoccus persicus]